MRSACHTDESGPRGAERLSRLARQRAANVSSRWGMQP
jgi:hypothetical protein